MHPLFLCLLLIALVQVKGQDTLYDCKVSLKEDHLVIQNSRFIVAYHWNNGDLRGKKISNITSAHTWELLDRHDENLWSPDSLPPISADLRVYQVINHVIYPDHLVAEVTTRYKDFDLQRRFMVYPDLGALAMHLYLKKNDGGNADPKHYFDEKISLPGKQWKLKSVEFFDRTDIHNNLVHTKESVAFSKPVNLRGNVLIATDLISDERLFVLKEAPLGESQLLYPGSDFLVKWGEITIQNLGVLYPEVPNNQWYQCYAYVLGIGGATDQETLLTIRDYMKSTRKQTEGGEEMIMLNTWGDRGQDGKISEGFALNELKKGKELGITHLQLDDGWQQGLSKNSKTASGNLWDQWSREDWEPHPSRFPSGLGPVVEAASNLGIELALWFHPSNANSYSSWKEDAQIVLDLYNKWGIRTFKIDGMELSDKNADIQMRKFFELVATRSNGEVIFNVDATAGRRGGYFYLNEYGNIFLENRYTDWGNYYPHWTLRNLWQLSEYVPPEKFQIEFLNNSRNPHMYDEDDPLRPSSIPFGYIFATAMAGQPLAWMESSGLPPEAFKINSNIETYKVVMDEFHKGSILPIGQEPDGQSWTGFQSITDNESGYILVYRENSEHASFEVQTFLPGNKHVRLEKVLGSGMSGEILSGKSGELEFIFPDKFSYGLFRYQVISSR